MENSNKGFGKKIIDPIRKVEKELLTLCDKNSNNGEYTNNEL